VKRFSVAGAVVVAVAFALAAWTELGPAGLGGSKSYLVVAGESMAPLVNEGDVVVLERASRYEVGEVAAYRNRALGVSVLHRIVGRTGKRFVFRGDGNARADHERPAAGDLVGRVWVVFPGLGDVLRPTALSIGAALGTLLCAALAGARAMRRPRRPAPV